MEPKKSLQTKIEAKLTFSLIKAELMLSLSLSLHRLIGSSDQEWMELQKKKNFAEKVNNKNESYLMLKRKIRNHFF